jgi:hypothetical protein
MVILENYKRVLASFVEKNNNQRVDLFAVLKMDDLIDKWSVLLAVDWITNENRQTVFSNIINSLQENLGKEEQDEIARVVFYSPNDDLIKLFFDKFSEGQYIKEDAKVNGNVVHEGYIIALEKPDTPATPVPPEFNA